MKSFYTHVTNHKWKLLYRGYANGRRISEKIDYKPFLFLPSNDRTPTSYSTVYGEPVRRNNFGSISEAQNFISEHKEIGGFRYYGITNWEYAYIAEEFPEKIEFDRSVMSIVSMDIECRSEQGFPDPTKAEEEITVITLRKNGKAYMFGLKCFEVPDETVNYYLCRDEKELLLKFLDKWEDLDIDILTGWNVSGFDIPYIINRLMKFFSEETVKRLSPWKIIESREVPTKWGKTIVEYDMVGITVLDYLPLYQKFSYKNQESYKLDHIASVELGENKTDYSEYGTLDRLYELNPQLYALYNLNDAALIDKLDAKLGYINIVLSLAYRAKCNYIDTLKTVRPWDTFIHYTLLNKGQVVPQINHSKISRKFVGGYVFEVDSGDYSWVVSFDLKSSYSHQIISYSISPDTLVEKHPLDLDDLDDIVQILDEGGIEKIGPDHEIFNKPAMKAIRYAKKNNYSMAANGCMFKRQEGFLAEIQSMLFNERAKIQVELAVLEEEYNKTKDPNLKNRIASLDAEQMSLKIFLNSGYGAIANEGFRWNDTDLAEAITMSGQLAVKTAEKVANKFVNKVLKDDKRRTIFGDTDSIGLEFKDLVARFNTTDKQKTIDMLVKVTDVHMAAVLKEGFALLGQTMNAWNPQIKMARENIADRAIWTAKKHYVMNVVDSKGIRYSEPKLKIVGLEAIKQTIPMICKENLKKGMKILLEKDNTEVVEFAQTFKKKFFKLKPYEMASPRGISNVTKYQDRNTIYIKGTPMHVRAALLYNYLLKKHDLENKYQVIRDGNKIRYLNLKLPNPLGENVIAFIDDFPEEFGLTPYIDYNIQYEKCFEAPLKQLTDACKISISNSYSFDQFFA